MIGLYNFCIEVLTTKMTARQVTIIPKTVKRFSIDISVSANENKVII